MSKCIETSIFELFKTGPGPSSSHTIGPMRAGFEFLTYLQGLSIQEKEQAKRIRVNLYGSLAATGKGHGTDRAILAGLLGIEPEKCPLGYLEKLFPKPNQEYQIDLKPGTVIFTARDIKYDKERIELKHQNTLRMELLNAENSIVCEREYYSVGGGFIDWLGRRMPSHGKPLYCYRSMNELKQIMRKKQVRLAELVLENEQAINGCTEEDIYARIDYQIAVMERAVNNGLATEGTLPGPIGYYRKAPGLHRRAQRLKGRHDQFMLQLCAYAFAAAEENAAGQPVVTAPTCGSSGVMAAITYFMKNHMKTEYATMQDAYLAAAVIGFLAKSNASISGAEVGCQGEIGVASSMAAAMLTYAVTSEIQVVENAAQIALEHHLGMTCDPIAGYVQIPCIERNAMGAVKAYTAYIIATTEISRYHRLNLDGTLHTMLMTGKDLQAKYRETACGGLATLEI